MTAQKCHAASSALHTCQTFVFRKYNSVVQHICPAALAFSYLPFCTLIKKKVTHISCVSIAQLELCKTQIAVMETPTFKKKGSNITRKKCLPSPEVFSWTYRYNGTLPKCNGNTWWSWRTESGSHDPFTSNADPALWLDKGGNRIFIDQVIKKEKVQQPGLAAKGKQTQESKCSSGEYCWTRFDKNYNPRHKILQLVRYTQTPA